MTVRTKQRQNHPHRIGERRSEHKSLVKRWEDSSLLERGTTMLLRRHVRVADKAFVTAVTCACSPWSRESDKSERKRNSNGAQNSVSGNPTGALVGSGWCLLSAASSCQSRGCTIRSRKVHSTLHGKRNTKRGLAFHGAACS